MHKTIDKELISHLLMLEENQQAEVLEYIKNLLAGSELDHRAEASEQAIAEGKVKTFDQFNIDFENWKKKRNAIG